MISTQSYFQARDPQQEAKEELENLKKQHDLLKRMLQQQEQLKALQGRQAALLALQQKAEQAIAVMDDSGRWKDRSTLKARVDINLVVPLGSQKSVSCYARWAGWDMCVSLGFFVFLREEVSGIQS